MTNLSLQEIEARIEQIERQIGELKLLREMHGRKLAAVAEAKEGVAALLEKTGLQESELFAIFSEQIVAWIKKSRPKAGAPAPRYWAELEALFGGQAKTTKVAATAGEGKDAGEAEAADEPAPLPGGKYVNPHTGASVLKIRRAPRELMDWCTAHGVETVRGWLVAR